LEAAVCDGEEHGAAIGRGVEHWVSSPSQKAASKELPEFLYITRTAERC